MSGPTPMPSPAFDLEVALRELGSELAVPAAHPELATRVRSRIVAEAPRRAGTRWWSRPMRRSLVLALAALLIAAAAVTAAIGYGLPGLRILFGPVESPSPSPAASTLQSGAPGATLGLGTAVTLAEAEGLVDFDVVVPAEPSIGPPDAVYLAGRRLTLVWAAGPGLPGTAIPGVGLLLMELRGEPDQGMIQKIIDSGTHVEAIEVAGAAGYWIDGEGHALEYTAPDGTVIPDSRRIAGNTLVWTADGVTYRLEGDFERDAAIALAETLR